MDVPLKYKYRVKGHVASNAEVLSTVLQKMQDE